MEDIIGSYLKKQKQTVNLFFLLPVESLTRYIETVRLCIMEDSAPYFPFSLSLCLFDVCILDILDKKKNKPIKIQQLLYIFIFF